MVDSMLKSKNQLLPAVPTHLVTTPLYHLLCTQLQAREMEPVHLTRTMWWGGRGPYNGRDGEVGEGEGGGRPGKVGL